ncbi:MAG: ABC transporter permease [Myxococcaceae bacterium]|nr:ABC transporter permease [Myxococcaceae bacterium]MCI0671338.1 ABC transporter permease [Myxococcaceae bacterium]
MRPLLEVAWQVLREAASRRWVLALFLGITAVLATLSFSLQLDVLDGALAATRLFGKALGTDIRAVDVALRPLLQASSYLIFYGGLGFGILASADFGPSLLAPGRIEHLLSLPLRRWQLLGGTFLGVLALSLMAALYGACGLVVLLGLKAGLWTVGPLLAALLASVTFAALYAVMLTGAVFVRSAAVSAALGAVLFVLGILAGYRARVATVFDPGLPRSVFRALTAVVPRVSSLADAGAAIAASEPLALRSLGSLLIGVLLFGMGALAVGVWRFEEKDF